jgi:hypothetical protein
LGNAESPLRRLITIVFTSFYQKLNDEGKEAVNNKLVTEPEALVGEQVGKLYWLRQPQV